MPAPYNLIEEKAEDAFEAYINHLKGSDLNGVAIIKGLEEDAGTYPALLIVGSEASPAQDAAPENGNWIVSMEFSVLSDMVNTARAAHKGYVGVLSDMLIVDDLVTHMANVIAATGSLVSDFVPDLWTPGKRRRTINAQGKRVTIISGELMCRSA